MGGLRAKRVQGSGYMEQGAGSRIWLIVRGFSSRLFSPRPYPKGPCIQMVYTLVPK